MRRLKMLLFDFVDGDGGRGVFDVVVEMCCVDVSVLWCECVFYVLCICEFYCGVLLLLCEDEGVLYRKVIRV